MPKISRPIVYTALGAVVACAVVLTQPDPVSHKRVVRAGKTAVSAPDGFTEADMTAHFARYTGRQRNAFTPGIANYNGRGTDGLPSNGRAGTWMLTGVNEVDGSLSALVENSATGDSAFLKVGDKWNGLTVRSINPAEVVFWNALGQETRLAFTTTEPNPDDTGGRSHVIPVPTAPPLPGIATASRSVGGLPPLPILPSQPGASPQGNSN